MFGKKKLTSKEQSRKVKRDISKSARDIEREKNGLERQEKDLIKEIKKAAAMGNQVKCFKCLNKPLTHDKKQQSTKILAKQLVQLRNQKQKLMLMKTNVNSIGLQATTMAAHVAMSTAIASTTKAMASAQMDAGDLKKTLMDFEKQNALMSMQEDMVQDALIDDFDQESEEENEIVEQVLQQVGLDLDAIMQDAPSTATTETAVGNKTKTKARVSY